MVTQGNIEEFKREGVGRRKWGNNLGKYMIQWEGDGQDNERARDE